jgi:ClpP class serine protease
MNIPDNLYSLTSAPLQIYPGAIEGLVAEVISRLKTGVKAEMPVCKVVGVNKVGNSQGTEGKSIMIIPVMKFISDEDIPDYGVIGTKTIQKIISACEADPNIIGVILHITNPGGTVMNTPETSFQIFETKKPVVAYIDKLGASSGFYLAMACKYIFASGRSTMVGNIGTKSQGIDLTGILEKLGAKSWEIFAPQSFDKDLGFTEALAGKPQKFQNAVLVPYADMFMGDAKKMRPQIKEEAMHGMVYVAEMAIEMGLIDAIGTMADAIAKVMELAEA